MSINYHQCSLQITPTHSPLPLVYIMAMSTEQRVFIVQKYYQFNKSVIEVQRAYDKEYGRYTTPSRPSITK